MFQTLQVIFGGIVACLTLLLYLNSQYNWGLDTKTIDMVMSGLGGLIVGAQLTVSDNSIHKAELTFKNPAPSEIAKVLDDQKQHLDSPADNPK
jgi:hypothetical protein